MKISSLPVGVAFFLFLVFCAPAWGIEQGGPISKALPEAKQNPRIVFEGDRLSARVKQAALEDVLRELAEQTFLAIEVNGSIADEKVSAIFDPTSLENGLHTLLRNKNYILMYTEVAPAEGSPEPQFVVEGIKIAGKGGSGPVFIRGKHEKMRPPPPPSPLNETASMSERNDPVEKHRPDRGGLFFNSMPVPPSQNRPEMPQNPSSPRHLEMLRNLPFSQQVAPQAPGAVQPDRRQEGAVVPNVVPEEKAIDEQIDDLDDLAFEQEMAAVPHLERVAQSSPHEEVRERALELIQNIKEDAE